MKEIVIPERIQEQALKGKPWADMNRAWTNVQRWLDAVARKMERERTK